MKVIPIVFFGHRVSAEPAENTTQTNCFCIELLWESGYGNYLDI